MRKLDVFLVTVYPNISMKVRVSSQNTFSKVSLYSRVLVRTQSVYIHNPVRERTVTLGSYDEIFWLNETSNRWRPIFRGGLYSGAAYIQGRPIFRGGLYSGAAYIQGRPIFRAGLYSGAAYIQGRPIFRGGLYSGAAYIQGRPIFRGGLYWRVTSN